MHTLAPALPDGAGSDGLQFLCFHGFGSNALSFEAVAGLVHERLRASRLMSFDFPGFGFTRRPRRPSDYGLAATARIGLALLRRVLRRGVAGAHREEEEGDGEDAQGAPRRVVLVGHSLGGNIAARVAALGLISGDLRREDIRALVLVAPALLAAGGPAAAAAAGTAGWARSLLSALLSGLTSAIGLVLRCAARACALAAALLLRYPLRYPVYELLRRLVYRESFWRQALRYCVLDAGVVTPELVENYSCPRRILDWEKGFLMFAVSQLSARARALSAGGARLDTDAKLLGYLRAAGVPILIVHGSADALVPLSNSVSLARGAGEGTSIHVMKAGHVPHEEDGEGFVGAVLRFLEETER